MEINNESIALFSKKFYFILNSSIPGFFCMDAFFKFGLFSKTITNVYEIILLIFWSVILSIPFSVVMSLRVTKFMSDLVHEIAIRKGQNGINKTVIAEKDDDESKNLKESIELVYNILRLVILFFIFNIYEYIYNKLDFIFVLFLPCVMLFIISFITLSLIEPFFSRIYTGVLKNVILGIMEERGDI